MSNLIINAGPGSGKTFTLIETFKFLMTGTIAGFRPTQEQYEIFVKIREMSPNLEPHDVVFLAFNTGIKNFLTEKLPAKTNVYTFNGLGVSEIRKRWGFKQLDKYRGQKILRQKLGPTFDSLTYTENLKYMNILTYIGHLKEELLPIEESSLFLISEKYGLPDIPTELELIRDLMHDMQKVDDCIDYRDQVWLGLQAIRHKRFKLALVDEAQDLSPLRLEFALAVAEQCVFCGDPYQSINGFAGADYAAFEKIRKISKLELPLKTCFRCTPNRIKRINEIRPARIVPFKTVDGPEERLTLEELPKRILQFASFHHESHDVPDPSIPHDLPLDASDYSKYLIISRTNANLVKVGLFLAQHRIPAQIIKRDEEESVDEILIRFLKSLNPLSTFDLVQKLNIQIKIAEAMPERAAMMQEDKCRSLLAVAEKAKHINEIPKMLRSLAPTNKGAVCLSTIHRAKGLQAPFVFILFPPVRHPKATSKDQIEQEINLEFVAESRSEYYNAYVTN